MSVTTMGRRAWNELGGRPELLDLVEEPSPPVGLASGLDVAGLLGDSVALAALAVQEVQVARGQLSTPVPVTLAGDRITTSAQSERHLLINGEPVNVWSPLSGFWRTGDGWVRTHGNYRHHADRLRHLLDLPAGATKAEVAAAIAARGSLELEEAATAAGAIVGAVRTPEEWATTPQAAAVASSPLIAVRRHAGSAPGQWSAAAADEPLAGVRVLDLTRVIAGPTATRDLAFAGADVLRVDSPRLPEIAAQHLDTGPGKRSTRLDLAASSDRRRFEDLLSSADVVVTGYRPGALDRHGLSPDALWERRPSLVVGTVDAWGRSGPWSHRRGFDSIVQAVTGIAMVESPDGRQPGAMPAQALDHAGGHFLAAAITHCLARQRDDGGGWAVGVSLARIAHELLQHRTVDRRAPEPPTATLQTATTSAGEITCAAPVLVYAGAPPEYPSLATPWGADDPAWRDAS